MARWTDAALPYPDVRPDADDDALRRKLLLADDLPWQDDGTRCFRTAADRRTFRRLVERSLDGRPVEQVGGTGDARTRAALGAIARHFPGLVPGGKPPSTDA